MTDLTSIIEKLEKAERPSRDLDAEIYNALPPASNAPYLPSYTSSIDAAVSLAERVLPGWRHAYEKRTDGACLAWADIADDEPAVPTTAATPALALVLATLRALQSRGDA